MKRVFSAILALTIFCAMACIGVSAEPMLLMTDSFDGTELNPQNWVTDPNANAFYVEDGWCVGDHNAVILQSMYGPEEDSGIVPKQWNYFAASVDVRFDDFSVDYAEQDYFAALWFRDYQLQEGVEYFEGDDIGTGSIYELRVYPVLLKVDLHVDFGSLLPETTTVEGQEVEEVEKEMVVATWNFPEDYEIAVDYSNPGICNLGVRIEANRIRGYLDGKLVIDYATPATICNMKPTPILFHNKGLMMGWDNVRVATVDYQLFAADLEPEASAPAPAPSDTGASEVIPQESSVVTERKVVTDTDEAGNIVSSVVVESSVVTAPPVANTNTNPSVGGSSTATGDMAFVVVAVMVVAIGTAIVVKKVNVK